MNLAHRYLCASTRWRIRVETALLPWVLDGVDLGSEVLEVGPGYGAATHGLRARVGHLTCVEVDRALSTRLAGLMAGHNVTVLCEDATRMSLADGAYDGAVSLAMLHHVPSAVLQDRLLAEVARVLRPGGAFVGFDGVAGKMFRLLHAFDTMVAIDPRTFAMRLASAGFTDIAIDVRNWGFRFRSRRASSA
jgi:SAM-dependent methyltransferase